MWFIRKVLILYYHLAGWKLDKSKMFDHPKAIVTGLPHTSNWDFVFCIATFAMLGIKIRFTIKKEWMRPPFGFIMRGLGALAINRGVRESTTDAIARLFSEHEQLHICVTPEGTRKLTPEWKSGFYWAAHKAGVPIGIGYLDYKNKVSGIAEFFHTTGDYEKDMRDFMKILSGLNLNGRHPERFMLDKRFAPTAQVTETSEIS